MLTDVGERQRRHAEVEPIAKRVEEVRRLRFEQIPEPEVVTPEQTRDYVYVGDVVRANLAAAESHATGAFNIAQRPAVAAALPQDIAQLTTVQYRSPGSLEEGGVMVVGAAASGVQIADEIHLSCRSIANEAGWR